MTEKIKLEFVSDIHFYKCASVGDDWEEKYADNETVLSLISKLLSAETPEDDGISEAMEELIMEIGGDEESYLYPMGELTVDGETPEDVEEEDEDYEAIISIEEGDVDFQGNHDFDSASGIYESQVKSSKVCVIESVQNKSHIASLEIDAPFDPLKLKYKNGWIEYDGESFDSEESQGNAIDRELYVDGEEPGNPSLNYIAEVVNSCIIIEQEYVELGGFEEGTKFEIKIGRKSIRLEKVEDEE